jgi:hypothetical protein
MPCFPVNSPQEAARGICAQEAARIMKDESSIRTSGDNPNRELRWSVQRSFQGWTCSQCEWNEPVPTLLHDPDAKTAYDRLAISKFRKHNCADYPVRLPSLEAESFTSRIRKLVSKGFKPKDAVELILQEVSIESPGQPKVLDQARQEGEDFLRRLRAGLI